MSTPLHWASRSGLLMMVTLLYKRGADLELKDSQGYNALHLAVHAGHTMMIVYLLACGIPVDSKDSMGRTALMWSSYQGNSTTGMAELLGNNPDIDMVDNTGYTALHWSVISQHYEFTKLLLSDGASHTIKDPAGKTPADWAEERGTLKIYNNILHTYKFNGKHSGVNNCDVVRWN
jgi:palmitoyltransferase ZDHHC13/17